MAACTTLDIHIINTSGRSANAVADLARAFVLVRPASHQKSTTLPRRATTFTLDLLQFPGILHAITYAMRNVYGRLA